MKISRFAVVISGLIIFLPSLAYSGSLDALAPPGSATSAMFTIEDIYKRLDTGTATAKRTGAFTEPTTGPDIATGHTIDEVMAKAPAKDDAGGVVSSNVLAGKTFWGLTGSNWGTQTGSLATQTLGSGTTTVSAGFYNATTLTAVDSNLATGNIRSGTAIFGVDGDSNVVDTSSGDAVAADIANGKKAWVAGILVTGTVTAGSSFAGVEGANPITIPDGLYSGGKTTTAIDSDLVAANVKAGVTIFGAVGTFTNDGDAVAGNILNGKKAYVNGILVIGNIATQTLDPGTATVNAGFYNATDLVTVDADLVTANIRSGVTIFGVPGSSTVVNTSTGDAVAGEILNGKKAWVNGIEIAGGLFAGVTCDIAGSATVNGTRWCDNGDGTVTDLTTGLIWLKDANNWGDEVVFWANASDTQNGRDRAASLTDAGNGDLSDGSVEGDWRLPTLKEFKQLITGTESVNFNNRRAFTNLIPNLPSNSYWSSTTLLLNTGVAWVVEMDDGSGIGTVTWNAKNGVDFVWPVRGGQ